MHKLTLMILLLICNISYSQQDLDTLIVVNHFIYSDSTGTLNKSYTQITLGNENIEKIVTRFYDGRPVRLDKLTYKSGNIIDSTISFTSFQKNVKVRIDDNTMLETVYEIKNELTQPMLEYKVLSKQLGCGYKNIERLYPIEELPGSGLCGNRNRGKHKTKYYCNGKLVQKYSKKYTFSLIPTIHVYITTTDSNNHILIKKKLIKKLGITSYYCISVYSYQNNLIKKARIETGRHKRQVSISETNYDYNDSLCIKKTQQISNHLSNELFTNILCEYKYDTLGRETEEIYYEYSYFLKKLVKRRKKEIVYY